MPRRHIRLVSARSVLLTAVISLSACNGDDTLSSQYSITEDEAAVIVANAFGSGSFTYGLTGQLEELVSIAGGRIVRGGPAGQPAALDTVTIIRSRNGEFGYTWRCFFSYGSADDQFVVEYDMRGTYDTPGMTSQDTVHASLRFTGLHGDTLLVSGSCWRLGRQNTTLAERKMFTSEILATVDNVGVARASQEVIGGTVAFTMIERFPDDHVVSLPGTLSYLHGHQAMLVINRKAFTVDLDTGLLTPP
jgi:hypothetical protein